MNSFFRLFTLLTIPAFLILSGCNQQSTTSQSNQNNQNVSSPPSQTAAKESGFVYTADERGNSISVIDLATNQVQKIPISVSPHNIQVSQDGRLLLVVGAPATGSGNSHGVKGEEQGGHDDSGGHGDASGKLLIFDTAKLNDAPSEIEIGQHSAHVVIDPQGKFIYATNSEDDTVSVVDAARER